MRHILCLLVVDVLILLAASYELIELTTPTTPIPEGAKPCFTPTTPEPEGAKTDPNGTKNAGCWYTSTLGKDYKGKVNKTKEGKECQRWDRNNAPHQHEFVRSPHRFPEDTVSEAENYCRNPDGDLRGPWCYTKDPQTRWSSCGVPKCTGPVSVSVPCPRGWEKSPAGTCLKSFYNQCLGYYGARKACRAIGAELFTLPELVDVRFLRGYMSVLYNRILKSRIPPRGVWIGGRLHDGVWIWDGIHRGKIHHTDWAAGQPYGGSQYCLSSYFLNNFNDNKCTRELAYICERA